MRPLCPAERKKEREYEPYSPQEGTASVVKSIFPHPPKAPIMGGQLAGGFDRPLMPWGRRRRVRTCPQPWRKKERVRLLKIRMSTPLQ